MRALHLLLPATVLLFCAASSPLACGTGDTGVGGGGGSGGWWPSSSSSSSGTSSSSSSSSSTSGGLGGGGGTGGQGPVSCPATFTFAPTDAVSNVRVAGEWQGFDPASAPVLSGPSAGVYSTTIDLPPGLWAYKIVYQDAGGNTQWVLDPTQGRRKYVGGLENSAIKVHDCGLPSLAVVSSEATRPAAGQGTYHAELAYHDAIDGTGPAPAAFTATLEHDGVETTLGAGQVTVAAGGAVTLALSGLADGKYRVVVKAKTKSGRESEPVRLIFWVEAEAFSWKDAIIYMVMTDRYRDADSSNNIPAPTPGADPRGDFQGGDLQGVRASIADGTLDKLGVRAIWLSPFGTNPPGAYLAADGVHMVTGYHGYWPVKGREVDPRWGGDAALEAMVIEAHKHGIRVLQDFVIHHVHSDHEYVAAHPDWFLLNGCVCATANCDWTAHALDCKFTDYLPNIDHQNPAANAAFNADAMWWLDRFNLDGFRIDAVKHVPEAATRNLAADVREEFEKAGTRYFLMGETAMGWDDCNPNLDPNCNAANYGTISKYIGPKGIDGQLDFVLYHGVSYRTFAYSDKGFIHADFWVKNGQQHWGPDAVMTPYIGSQDTARFTTLADYRGQDAAHDRGIPGNQWSNTAVAPVDAEPYKRARVAFAWLLELPGAPLLYYGDEYGQWGGSDPNNRLMWRNESALTADEAATLSFIRKLGAARRATPALRRGAYVSLYNTSEDTQVYGRTITPGNGAMVGFTRLGTAQPVSFDAASALGFSPGTVLHDAMGGPDVTVGAGSTSLTIPASGAVILAP
jgi:glycosidase